MTKHKYWETDNKVVVITGATCSGKSEIVKALLSEEGFLSKVITTTTRKIREGETEGLDYYFVPDKKFVDIANQGRFAEISIYGGEFYGTEKKHFKDSISAGLIPIMILDVDGAIAFKRKNAHNAFVIYVGTPAGVDLRQRMKGREYTVAEERKRLALLDYETNKSDRFLVKVFNEKLSKSIHEVRDLIVDYRDNPVWKLKTIKGVDDERDV